MEILSQINWLLVLYGAAVGTTIGALVGLVVFIIMKRRR